MPTSDCFVYVQLPGSLEVVTCGRFVQEEGVGRFVYRRRYLEDARAVELDKFELPLRAGTFETARPGGIFGALRDASPDSWGRRIIERALKRVDLTEVDYLVHSPEDRAGALSFGEAPEPPALIHRYNQVLQLQALLEEAERIEAGLPASEQTASLLQPGTSMGGARPKNVVEDDGALWLAKFPSRGDRWNYEAVEGAMLDLAGQCGLHVPETKLLKVAKRDVLLVKRFDRERVDEGYHRHRMVSGLTVLRADESGTDRTRWSYLLLADEVRRWVTHPEEDLRELFGRMVFNALVSNADDHPRNHALIADSRGWRLSPAYDLNPVPSISMEHRDLALAVGDQGRWANRKNLLSRCQRFGLSTEEANASIDEMKRVITASWRQTVLRHGATEADCEVIAPAFAYSGFEYT